MRCAFFKVIFSCLDKYLGVCEFFFIKCNLSIHLHNCKLYIGGREDTILTSFFQGFFKKGSRNVCNTHNIYVLKPNSLIDILD